MCTGVETLTPLRKEVMTLVVCFHFAVYSKLLPHSLVAVKGAPKTRPQWIAKHEVIKRGQPTRNTSVVIVATEACSGSGRNQGPLSSVVNTSSWTSRWRRSQPLMRIFLSSSDIYNYKPGNYSQADLSSCSFDVYITDMRVSTTILLYDMPGEGTSSSCSVSISAKKNWVEGFVVRKSRRVFEKEVALHRFILDFDEWMKERHHLWMNDVRWIEKRFVGFKI